MAAAVRPYLPADVAGHLVPPRADPVDGAIMMARRAAGLEAAMVSADVFDRRRFQSDGNAPLYLRLKRLVTDAIDQGRLAETEAIPGERDVARMLGISRVTVRKAFADLVTDGVLVQRQGAGTFVARHAPRYELPMSRLTSFTEDMRLRGIATDVRWLDRSEGLPTPEEAMVLALSPGEKVCRLHRLRRADGVPLAVEFAVVPSQFLPDPMAVAEFALRRARGERLQAGARAPAPPRRRAVERQRRCTSTWPTAVRRCSSSVFPF